MNSIIRDILANAQDAKNNAEIDWAIKHKYLLKKNKTNAVILDNIIYRKGEYINISKPIEPPKLEQEMK